MKNTCSALVFVLVLTFHCIVPPNSYSQIKPKVVSTIPANGATGVSPDIRSFSVTFSKTMDGKPCGANTTNWIGAGDPGNKCEWSADKKTMTVTRGTAAPPIGTGAKVTVYLNPPGYASLIDTDGIFLDPYTFSFTIYTAEKLEKIPADPQKGFSWPYYLYSPNLIKKPAVLMVESNNTGTVSDDQTVHDTAAYNQIYNKRYFADTLGVPFLVPTFPRPASDLTTYTHALDRRTILTKTPDLERIDLQLIKMIEDARGRLAAAGNPVDNKFFMMGVSASGSFASRFVMLHPESVKAASIGAPGWGPIVPVTSWNGYNLPYPEGIADLKDLVGTPLAVDAFRTVPLQVYVGDMDINIYPFWTLSDPEVALVNAAFGPLYGYERWPEYERAYHSVSSFSQFVIFPGMGHTLPPMDYMIEFFERNRGAAQAPLPKPLVYTLYFPHVASGGQWETEIALTNTTAIPVAGELRAMKASGGDPLESVPIAIPAEGRVEVTVGESFQRPQEIAYLSFASDSGFLAGYTRFYQPGNRASLAIGTQSNNGWFTKMEKDGWTGIAFVNVDTVTSTAALTAWDDNGNQVAATTLPLTPGQKFVGMVDQLFKSDLTNATYFRYSSDKKVLGFTVSGSADGQMLDGLHALGDYIPAKK